MLTFHARRSLVATLIGAAVLAGLAAATPASAIQNTSTGDMGSACTYVEVNHYYCVFDNGQSYFCKSKWPKGPEECTPAIRSKPGSTLKVNPGQLKQTR